MDSDSDKENYFSLYMKKKKSDFGKKTNYISNKRFKNQSTSSQKINDENKNKLKLLLESSEKKKKNKNAFSFVKSYLINFKDKLSVKNKNMTIEKRKIKNEKFNKSTNDIKNYVISSPKTNYEINKDKKDNNQKIEKLKKRIFNLMDIINTFEADFIKSKKPLQIKEQFDKIKYKIPISLTKDKNQNKTFKSLDITDNIPKTGRQYINSKLFEDYNINNLEDKNNIYTKRANGIRQHSAMNKRFSSDKNIAIILLNKQKKNNNKKTINKNSTFLKLISSNLITKNELKKVNSNFTKNKSKSLVNKINSNSSSNKTLYKNDNLDENEKKKNIFKRRINYSNFINQKIKQNKIIQRNNGSYLKQNIINKSKIKNKSNSCKTCFDANSNDNYVKNLLNKNNKSKSIDRSNLIMVNSVNNINPLKI